MGDWVFFKAPVCERGKQKNPRDRQRYCRICGARVYGGTVCPSCRVKEKQKGASDRVEKIRSGSNLL